MDFVNTYLMVHGLSGLRSNPNIYRPSSPADALSFRSIFEELQNKNTVSAQKKTDTGVASSVSAGSSLDAIFEEAAQKYDVDANLLKAIGKAESDFDPSVVSPAGAIGVMQLMPGTARSLGVSDPYDARQNIMGGAKYISQLLDQYDGNTRLALAAYNAGPGNVSKYGGIPPFQETQNYVTRVLGYAGETISVPGTASSASAPAAKDTAAEGATALSAKDSTVEIKTETLLALLSLMRSQMDFRINAALNATDRTNTPFSF